MPVQYWSSLLNAGAPWTTTAGSALSTATTATISPQSGGSNDFTLPANYLYEGLVLRFWGQGLLTTTGTSTTATFFIAGNNAGSFTTILTTTGLTTGTGSITGLQWQIEAFLTVTAPGSSGNTVSCQGQMQFNTSVPANPAAIAANSMILPMPNSNGATATALNTTVALGFPLRATLAGANATIQCTQWFIEALS